MSERRLVDPECGWARRRLRELTERNPDGPAAFSWAPARGEPVELDAAERAARDALVADLPRGPGKATGLGPTAYRGAYAGAGNRYRAEESVPEPVAPRPPSCRGAASH